LKVSGRLFKNATFLASQSGNYVFMAPIIRRMRQRYPAFYSSGTEICIEGYPRSGNSFFTHVFQRWNPGVEVAHHSHLAASPKLASSDGIPVVILIRHPLEAVSSVVAWDGQLNPGLGLWAYQMYYNALWHHRDKLVVIPFEQAVTDPGVCIERVNERYGMEYRYCDLNSQELDTISSEMAAGDDNHGRSGSNATLPNAEKAAMKLRYRELLQASPYLDAAVAVYKRYMSLADFGQ
jgi:hypothetical protein